MNQESDTRFIDDYIEEVLFAEVYDGEITVVLVEV